MNEKQKKVLRDLELLQIAPCKDQGEVFESVLDKLEDWEFELIDKCCMRLVRTMRYVSPRANIEYKDGLEVLVKLGLFISLAEKKKVDHSMLEAGREKYG